MKRKGLDKKDWFWLGALALTGICKVLGWAAREEPNEKPPVKTPEPKKKTRRRRRETVFQSPAIGAKIAKQGYHLHKCPECGKVWHHVNGRAYGRGKGGDRCPERGCQGHSYTELLEVETYPTVKVHRGSYSSL
jgi:hypothetical protein